MHSFITFHYYYAFSIIILCKLCSIVIPLRQESRGKEWQTMNMLKQYRHQHLWNFKN